MVQSSVCGKEETLAMMRDAGLVPEVLPSHHGPLGPALSARAEQLEPPVHSPPVSATRSSWCSAAPRTQAA